MLGRYMLPPLLVSVGIATLIAANELMLDRSAVIAWVVFALLLAGVFWQVHRMTAREMRQNAAMAEALQRLAENLSHVAAGLGADAQVLGQLADSGRSMLEMERSGIGVVDARHGLLNILAFSGDITPDSPRTFRLSELTLIRGCLKSGEVLFEEDIRRRAGAVNLQVAGLFRAAAVILLPLKVRGTVIGLFALSSSTPRRFTRTQRQMAQLLAMEAAVILHNHRLYEEMRAEKDQRAMLYEQTQRDAVTRATLLRELQHRVKNSFTAIIGLLMMTMNGLPAAARPAVQRVIDRVRAMASVHDMFAGGIPTATLRQIIRQMLPLVMAIKPPGIAVHEDIADGPPMLDTPRAMALAMAVFELCCNAIVHRRTPEGNVWIRSRAAPVSVAIDVIDDGPGPLADVGGRPDPPPAARGGGIGLQLVRELVGRELGGTFSVCGRPGGGTVATIELPLRSQEGDAA